MKGRRVKWGTGTTIAAVALAIMLAAIGYRIWWGGDEAPAEAATGAMSAPSSLDELRERAEAAPDDAEAWQRLGFAYFEQSMFAESADAYERATQNAPESAVLWSSLGEARVMASEDEPLPLPALEAFNRAIELDSGDPRARYFLGVKKDLSGDHQGAITDWLALLADTPPGAPWENDLVRTIEQVGAINEIEVSERIATAAQTRDLLPTPAMAGIPGPTPEQMQAASSMSPSQQQDMAEGMVERLAARLESEPGNVGGWIMLMRSYKTLERDEAAQEAYDRALQANPGAAGQLREAAETLGIG